MKIGYPNHPRKPLLQEIEWIGRNRFDFFDLFLEEDQASPEKVEIERTRKLLRKYGLGIVGHTACYLPIGSPVKALRETAVSEALRCFEVLHRLGAEFVTMHANWPIAMFSAKDGIRFQVSALKKLHIHLHDNLQNLDLHLPMGCGNIDWERTLKCLKKYYDGTITLEVFSRDRDYVLLTKEKLARLWRRI